MAYNPKTSIPMPSYRSDHYGHSGYDHSGHSGHSGYGHDTGYSSHGYGYKEEDCPGIPVSLLMLTLGGLGTLGYILYTKITMTERRRKKRNIEIDYMETLLYHGLEEFEEKIDRIAENKESNTSWISKIYKEFSEKYGKDNFENESLDGLEPPILDETWGLGARKSSNFDNTTSNTFKLQEQGYTIEVQKKRKQNNLIGESMCKKTIWRCFSSIIEDSLHYMENSEGLIGLAKKTMFKTAFHGSLSNVWKSLMSIPEARKIKKCMNKYQECIAYEIIVRGSISNSDTKDQDLREFINLTEENVIEDHEVENKIHRKRLIINPEFVQSLDQSDGRLENDEN